MKNIVLSKKQKRIIYASLLSLSYVSGIASHNRLVAMYTLAHDLIAPAPKVYKAPLSEYETLGNALWQSPEHQAICKADAYAQTAMKLARKYLDEAEKQSAYTPSQKN